MIHMRPSVESDVPRQRELWTLAFGDGGDYVDNFYHNYYRPERVVVLEEDGVVQSMTAWFDTDLVMPDGERWKAGYLYAVATHPGARGKGLAGALLKYADGYLKEEHRCRAVTTVPAQPSLHNFFGANGFRECFAHDQWVLRPEGLPSPAPGFALEAVGAGEYGRLREELLADLPHIAYPLDALEYQAGCCRISGGGLYRADTGAGTALLCAEGMENGQLMLKELLGVPEARERLLGGLPRLLPAFGGLYRCPGTGVPFGMLKWLEPELEKRWDWSSGAYMGLGFD